MLTFLAETLRHRNKEIHTEIGKKVAKTRGCFDHADSRGEDAKRRQSPKAGAGPDGTAVPQGLSSAGGCRELQPSNVCQP